tara:strand:- start:588 stop:1079 length:492 start_codon:yes stop_codon:yes gene_type:complete
MQPFVTAILILVFATTTPADAQTGGIDTRYAPDDIQRYLLDGLTSEISVAHVRYHGLHFFPEEENLKKDALRRLAEDELRNVALSESDSKMTDLRDKMENMQLASGFIAAFDRAWDWRKALQSMSRKQIVALRNEYASRPGNLRLNQWIADRLDIEIRWLEKN